MRLKIVLLVAGVLAMVSLSALPANAAFHQMCDNNDGSSLCLNNNHGSQLQFNAVIGYSANDPNNDYQPYWLAGACGDGLVHSNCPYKIGLGLNLAHLGQKILAIQGPDGWCVGTDPAFETTRADVCPGRNGLAGGFGTVVVMDGWPNSSAYGVSNVDWSNIRNTYGQDVWMCTTIKGQPLIMSDTRLAHVCYFNLF